MSKVNFDKYAEYYDALNSTKNYELEIENILSELRKMGLNRFNNCLEFGCGTGKYTEFLARKFRSITATDLSTDMLNTAKHNIPKLGIDFHQFDLRDFKVLGSYDLLFAGFHVVSYINTIHDLRNFVNVCYSNSEKGAFVAFDFWCYSSLMYQSLNETVRKSTADNLEIVRRSSINRNYLESTVDVNFDFSIHGKNIETLTFSEAHKMKFWTVDILDLVFAEKGFMRLGIFDINNCLTPNEKTFAPCIVYKRGLENK